MILEVAFIALIIALAAYLIRHYVFTLTVLYGRKKSTCQIDETNFQPKVSVLIPARNEETVIGRLLQRMCELTYPKEKLEVIVIDDASTDRTGEIAEAFAKTHTFIKVVHSDSINGGKGKPRALNEGLAHASGEIICVLMQTIFPSGTS